MGPCIDRHHAGAAADRAAVEVSKSSTAGNQPWVSRYRSSREIPGRGSSRITFAASRSEISATASSTPWEWREAEWVWMKTGGKGDGAPIATSMLGELAQNG